MAQARARRKKGAEAAEAVISVLSQKWEPIIILKIAQEL
jgi:DNA-binding HxlR family transcriptional regulator